MTKVITYGTYDLLHHGHIHLLKRAKALGDYLIVGVTSDDFDKARGKINVQQSLEERIEAIRNTGLADKIIIEQYEGQKIDDIIKYNVDIFTVGSDWGNKFDYLNEYCKVIYLDRTLGVSSTDLRTEKRKIRMGIVGNVPFLTKFINESANVDGLEITSIYYGDMVSDFEKDNPLDIKGSWDELLNDVDAVYIITPPRLHYTYIKQALMRGKHILCESPITVNVGKFDELVSLANQNKCILLDAIRTAFSTAYHRLHLLVKGGIIGDVVSIDATCTSLRNVQFPPPNDNTQWNGFYLWGATALLPIIQILGNNYVSKTIYKCLNENQFDIFTKVDFHFPKAVATAKVGTGVKSEGELIISGTKGYIYVPAPWWKTDYFEVRFENKDNNRRFFYQLDGEGIRYELVSFVNAISNNSSESYISRKTSRTIVSIYSDYENNIDCIPL